MSNTSKMSLLREGDTDNVGFFKDEDNTNKVSLFEGEVVLVKEKDNKEEFSLVDETKEDDEKESE